MTTKNRDDENCGNCKHYMDGECHRHAPKPILHGQMDQDSLDSMDSYSVAWPVLDSSDWCGEWEISNQK